jgi:hypothetical protein
MCEAVRKLLTIKILLALLLVSVSGNAFLAYKLNQISDQLTQLEGDQALIREKTERAIKNARSTNLVPQKPITSW